MTCGSVCRLISRIVSLMRSSRLRQSSVFRAERLFAYVVVMTQLYRRQWDAGSRQRPMGEDGGQRTMSGASLLPDPNVNVPDGCEAAAVGPLDADKVLA